MSTASLSALSHEHTDPAILLWNDTAHIAISKKEESGVVHAGAS